MKKFLQYMFSILFIKNVLIAIGIVTGIVLFTLLYIHIYTHHGRSFSTPDFTGLTVEESEDIIEDKSLRYIIFDSIYMSEYPAGVIVEQHPRPDFLIKKNRKIFFTINASGPEMIAVPSLIAETFRDASSKLSALGMSLGNLSYRYDITRDVVLEQRYEDEILIKGTKIPKGSKIDLVLGKGLGNETAAIPKLKGFSESEARQRAGERSFSIASVIPDPDLDIENLPDTVVPFVWRQRPEGGTFKRLGSHIDIWITIDSVKIMPPVDESAADSVTSLYDDLFNADTIN